MSLFFGEDITNYLLLWKKVETKSGAKKNFAQPTSYIQDIKCDLCNEACDKFWMFFDVLQSTPYWVDGEKSIV